MSLQFISDSAGNTTGVYIPIKEWNELKSRFKGIEEEGTDIPDWQKTIVNQRLADHKNNPGIAMDFDAAMDDIDNDL